MRSFKMQFRRQLTNDEIKHRILTIYSRFVSDVDPDLLGDYLKQENVLSIDQWQKIYAENKAAKDRCRAVLDFLLSNNHPTAFLVIRHALEEDGHYLLETIDKEAERIHQVNKEPNAVAGRNHSTRQRFFSVVNGQWINSRVTQFENLLHPATQEYLAELQDKQPISLPRPESINSRVARLSVRYQQLKQELESDQKTRTEELTVKLMAQIYEVEHKYRTANTESRNSQGQLKLKLLQQEEQLIKQREKYEEQLSNNQVIIEQLRQKLEQQANEQTQNNVAQACQYKPSSQPIKVLRTNGGTKGKRIRGITILGKELFLVHAHSSEIEVYNSDEFRLNRTMTLDHKDSTVFHHIASCSQNNCLYIMKDNEQHSPKAILKVNPSGTLIKEWSTYNDNGRLSVAYDSNVILAVSELNKLNEYTSEGQLIREIQLSSHAGFVHPWHAVKQSSTRYLVSHGSCHHKDPLHRVCIADNEGDIRLSFGGKRGSSERKLNGPMQLIVDRSGYILVNDTKNARVLLLNPSLDFVQELVSKEAGSLRNPRCLCLDEANGRLLVADNEALRDGRILVFKVK